MCTSCVIRCLFFFFFSSRRRHTRLQGDWSSDVCSSDLQGCTLHFTGIISSRAKDSSIGDEPGGCERFHSRLFCGAGWILWVVGSLLATLRVCLARIPRICGL